MNMHKEGFLTAPISPELLLSSRFILPILLVKSSEKYIYIEMYKKRNNEEWLILIKIMYSFEKHTCWLLWITIWRAFRHVIWVIFWYSKVFLSEICHTQKLITNIKTDSNTSKITQISYLTNPNQNRKWNSEWRDSDW